MADVGQPPRLHRSARHGPAMHGANEPHRPPRRVRRRRLWDVSRTCHGRVLDMRPSLPPRAVRRRRLLHLVEDDPPKGEVLERRRASVRVRLSRAQPQACGHISHMSQDASSTCPPGERAAVRPARRSRLLSKKRSMWTSSFISTSYVASTTSASASRSTYHHVSGHVSDACPGHVMSASPRAARPSGGRSLAVAGTRRAVPAAPSSAAPHARQPRRRPPQGIPQS